MTRLLATSQPGAPDSPATPTSLPGAGRGGDCAARPPPGDNGTAMSTRMLILAALVCGVAILAASAIQILMAN